MFKVNNKTLEQRHQRRSGVFIVNFEHNSHLFFSVFFVNFEEMLTQQTFTCSNSTKKHQEKVSNMFKFNNEETRTTSLTSL